LSYNIPSNKGGIILYIKKKNGKQEKGQHETEFRNDYYGITDVEMC